MCACAHLRVRAGACTRARCAHGMVPCLDGREARLEAAGGVIVEARLRGIRQLPRTGKQQHSGACHRGQQRGPDHIPAESLCSQGASPSGPRTRGFWAGASIPPSSMIRDTLVNGRAVCFCSAHHVLGVLFAAEEGKKRVCADRTAPLTSKAPLQAASPRRDWGTARSPTWP